MSSFEKNFIHSNSMRTVCEVLREIYWETDNEVVREKVTEAIHMTKRMDRKLREYKTDWDKDEWEKVENPEDITKQRVLQYINEQKK